MAAKAKLPFSDQKGKMCTKAEAKSQSKAKAESKKQADSQVSKDGDADLAKAVLKRPAGYVLKKPSAANLENWAAASEEEKEDEDAEKEDEDVHTVHSVETQHSALPTASEPRLMVSVTMIALSGTVLHRQDYPTKDTLTIGHFIGIAKRHLGVQEHRISLIIDTHHFAADSNNAQIMTLMAVKDFIYNNGCLIIQVIQLPDSHRSGS